MHNDYELPSIKLKPKRIAEPKVPPSQLDDACPIDFSRVPAAQDSFCAIQRTSVVTIRKQFVLAYGLLEKRSCRAHLDPKRRIVAFTFLDAQEEGAIKVTMQESTAYINIHSFLKRNGMRLVQSGSVPILWAEEQNCVFVVLENAIIKNDMP